MGTERLPRVTSVTRVERRESSWVFQAGRHRLGFSRVHYHALLQSPYARPVARRRTPLTAIAGTMLAVIGASTIVIIAVQAPTASARAPYVVRVPLPARAPLVEPALDAPAVPPRRASRPAIVAKAPPGAPAIAAPRPEPVVATIGDESDAEPATLATRAAAVRAASVRGTLQQWSDPVSLEHGFVVAGPSDGRCRSLSILTRKPGSEDVVEARKECDGGREQTAS